MPLGVVFNRCNPQGEFCEINRGQPVVMYIRFSPQFGQARALGGALHAYIHNGWHNWNLRHRADVCNFLINDRECPINIGEHATYELRYIVPVNIPLRQVFLLHFRIQDQNGRSAACFIVNVLTRT